MISGQLMVSSKADIIAFVNSNPVQRRGILLIFVALGGVFIDAYDFVSLGIGSNQITQLFHLSAFTLGFVTSIMALGALIGALVGGRITDKYGRNLVFMLDLVLLVVAALGAALSTTYSWLLIFRFLMGFGVGMDMPVALSFISEFSNLNKKSRYVNFWQGFWYIATVFSGILALVLYFLGVSATMWRWSVGFGGFLALIVLILRYLYMNESPMWAANNLPLFDAAKIVERTYGITVQVKASTVESVNRSKTVPFSILFSKKYRSRSLLAMTISATQSLEYYAIGFYIPVISTFVFGKGLLHSVTGTIIFNLFGIIGGFTGAYISTRYGMRKLAIWGFLIVIASLLFAGLTNGYVPLLLGALPIATFIFGHSMGPGAQGKTMAALSYPTTLRALGTGGSEAASRVGSIIGFFFFPVLLASLGLSYTLIILIVCPLLGLIAAAIIKWDPNGKDVENEFVEVVDSGEFVTGV
ncbi:MFS transporter [Alicyclobacillus dauci]|uniref:MFS transporter n=1 Tax=Alicyclobacillus dauci TaxID=1475485 RepID=A0ABY6YXI7_9BACL|nr:MFS transporter [Alicyclobacillus dauci]WAH35185.1 MFS transporter [Alicyclobacillus dauci]